MRRSFMLLLPAVFLAATEVRMTLTLRSPAFAAGAAIPAEYTCDGANHSPPLEWSGAPAGTRSFAFIMDDPDAPDPKAPKMTWVHWILYDMPASATGLQSAVSPKQLPPGTREGTEQREAHDVRRPLSADRPPPLLPQALRPRHHARRSGPADDGSSCSRP